MNTSVTTEAGAAAVRLSSRKRTLVAFALATVAVTGIGAAATSAAWTADSQFSAQAGAATFSLQGSLDGVTFSESHESAITLVVPADKLANLLPGQTRTIDLWVSNGGSVNAALTGAASFASSTFPDAPALAVNDLAATLTPVATAGAVDKFQLSVTTPANWSTANQNGAGVIIVKISGTATAS